MLLSGWMITLYSTSGANIWLDDRNIFFYLVLSSSEMIALIHIIVLPDSNIEIIDWPGNNVDIAVWLDDILFVVIYLDDNIDVIIQMEDNILLNMRWGGVFIFWLDNNIDVIILLGHIIHIFLFI
jgi:hypothetical protein